MDKGIVYVGMDLGTFKTSVASSTGLRDALYSAVGWPKDQIARTLLGRAVVFGKDIVEHRLALNIVRPFEKGVLKYNAATATGLAADRVEKHKLAAKLLVEHAVAMTRPPKDATVYGVIGAPSRATAGNKKVVLEAARGAFDAALIVSEPFTIAYGMNRLSDTLVIDIGAGVPLLTTSTRSDPVPLKRRNTTSSASSSTVGPTTSEPTTPSNCTSARR